MDNWGDEVNTVPFTGILYRLPAMAGDHVVACFSYWVLQRETLCLQPKRCSPTHEVWYKLTSKVVTVVQLLQAMPLYAYILSDFYFHWFTFFMCSLIYNIWRLVRLTFWHLSHVQSANFTCTSLLKHIWGGAALLFPVIHSQSWPR